MTRLLVTGGAGFIGSCIVHQALTRGWQVRVVDSVSPDVHRRAYRPADGVEFVHGDVRDAEAIDASLIDVDVVSHQAAKVGLGVDFADAPHYTRDNVLGTAELLAGMTRAGVERLVLASSMVVYGEGRYVGPDGATRPGPRRTADLESGMFEPRDLRSGAVLRPELIEEDAALEPRSIYAVTKVAQEHLAGVWARETRGRVALLRYHNVYGPGMPRDTPYAGVAAIFRSALEHGHAPTVFEDGGQRRDFVHVDDIAAANIAAIQWTADAASDPVRPFNIGSGTVSTILEVARGLSRARGGPDPVVTGAFRAGDVRHITASSARALAELDWAPTVSLSEGLREFAHAPLRD